MNTAFLALLSMALLAMSGLAIDGGQLFVARRDAQALADAAARAGAGELDEIAARTNPDAPLQIDPVAAADAAAAYVTDVRPAATLAIVSVDAYYIAVQVTSSPVSVTLLQLAGVGTTVRVQATGVTAPQTGITEPGQ
jgi:Flp pilus assembly protein TadG